MHLAKPRKVSIIMIHISQLHYINEMQYKTWHIKGSTLTQPIEAIADTPF